MYERLINLTDDPGIKDALGFLMTREIAHQKSFEKALYAIADNFPSGKLPGLKSFANTYVNTSQGGAEANGSWNSGKQWDRVDELEAAFPRTAAMARLPFSWIRLTRRHLKPWQLAQRRSQGVTRRPERI